MRHSPRLVVLGAGTAGTLAANKLRRRFGEAELMITVIDQDNDHLYQPASTDLFGLTKADLVDSVEDIITVGEFYDMAAGGEIIFT